MSKASQIQLLEDLVDALEAYSPDWRKDTADKRTHNFTARYSDIKQAIVDRLTLPEPRGPAMTRKEVEEMMSIAGLDTAIRQTLSSIRESLKSYRSEDVRISFAAGNNQNVIRAIIHGEPANSTNLYGVLYRRYADELEILATKVSEGASRFSGKEVSFLSRKFFNLSHEDREGILESYIREAVQTAVDKVNSTARQKMSLNEIIKVINTNENYIDIIRDTSTEEMNVFLGSRVQNAVDGNISRDKADRLQKWAQDALRDLRKMGAKKLANLPGSDSFAEIKRKQSVKAIIEPFKDIPGVSIKLDFDTKIKHSKTKVSASKKAKIQQGKVSTPKIKQISRKRQRKTGTQSPVRLIPLINAKLPETVAKNMGAPRLENRTGRFASSPRVLDAQTTEKGFISFGYTYEKNPYSVFERTSGSRFADANRDPRDLIDLSIREIAQQLMAGRFYTRRL